MQSFLGFLVFILALMALMATRTPVAVALGTIGIIGTTIFISPDALRQLGNIAFTQSSNFVLVVVPLFVLMGEALAATGIGNDLFRAAHMWLRRLPSLPRPSMAWKDSMSRSFFCKTVRFLT